MGQSKELFQKYREGEVSLLDATLQLREIRKSHEQEIQEIKDFEYENIQEFEQFKGEPFMGFDFSVVNGRKTYDYSKVQEVMEANEKIKQAQASAKAAFDFYQKTGQRPITEDGELVELPEINYGKSYLKITKTKK